MSQLKLTADGGGGTVAIKGPASTTGNNGFYLTVPGTASGTILTSNSSVGKILQVKTAFSNTHQTSVSTSYVDLSGLSVSITPSSSSNKILIICTIAISKDDNHSFLGRVVKDGSAISGSGGVKESGHSNQRDGVWWTIRTTSNHALPSTQQFLDTAGSTSAITYKAQGSTNNSSAGFAFNRMLSGTDNAFASPCSSFLTLMEVAA